MKIVSVNGRIVHAENVQFDISQIETMYGLAVYETLKVRNRRIFFEMLHVERLLYSARMIDLKHEFMQESIVQWIHEFARQIDDNSFNIKILLKGANKPQDAVVYLLAFPPRYIEKKEYRTGVSLDVVSYERWMPQAKTLNMLPSYYYYTHAKEKKKYDALCLDRNMNATECTSANVYGMYGTEIIHPPKQHILHGVTMMTILTVAQDHGYTISERNIPFNEIARFDAFFISSTSIKILPIYRVGKIKMHVDHTPLRELMNYYKRYLEHYANTCTHI